MQVIAAIVIGILLGHFYPDVGTSLKPLGDAFIKLVKMIIAPVIFLTVVTGISGMTHMANVGRVAGKAAVLSDLLHACIDCWYDCCKLGSTW